MRTALLAAALAFAAPAASRAEEATKLQEALIVEWMVAHCDFNEKHSLGIMVASMTINGSDPEQVQKDRAFIQERFAETLTVEEACASFNPPAKARPEYKTTK